MTLEATQLLEMYRKMVRIRRFEERLVELFKVQDVFPGKHHSSMGQEAIAVGACMAMGPKDYLCSTHRLVGHCVTRGMDMGRLMAEFMGKETGYSRGKGGMMHVMDLALNVLPTNAIVGSNIPFAAGAALALRLRGESGAVVCFFGDGASNTGAFHEGLNLAAAWRLPVVFICENNKYAVSTTPEMSMPSVQVGMRAAAYGIPGVRIDGNDPLAVFDAVSHALARARDGEGPTLIEAMTYRLRGHYEGDRLEYRPQEEYTEALSREPVRRFRTSLLDEQVALEAEIFEIEGRVQKEVEAAEQFARSSPLPPVSCLLEDVYA